LFGQPHIRLFGGELGNFRMRRNTLYLAEIVRVPTHLGKSWNLRKEFSRPGKSWKMTVLMESHGIPPSGHGIFLTF